MAKIITIWNLKGGVGKSDVTRNLAGALSEMGFKSLLVDTDPQGNLGVSFGVNIYQLEKSTLDVLLHKTKVKDVLIKVRENIHLVPSNLQLARAEPKLVGEYRREDRLKNALVSVENQYDFILIDTPPFLGMLTVNALSATQALIVPVACEYYALVGVRLILETVADIQEGSVNPALKILGILPTRFDQRTLHAREVLEDLRSSLEPRYKVFDTVIRETVKIKDAPVAHQTIFEFSSDHPVAEDYRQLAKEVLAQYEQTNVN